MTEQEKLEKLKTISDTYNRGNLSKGSEQYFKMQTARFEKLHKEHKIKSDRLIKEKGELNTKITELEKKETDKTITKEEKEELAKSRKRVKGIDNELADLKEKMEALSKKIKDLSKEHSEMEKAMGDLVKELSKTPEFKAFINEEYAKSYDRRMKEVEDRKKERTNKLHTVEKIEKFVRNDSEFEEKMNDALKAGAELTDLVMKKENLERRLQSIEDQTSPEYADAKMQLEEVEENINTKTPDVDSKYNIAYKRFASKLPGKESEAYVSKEGFVEAVKDMVEVTQIKKGNVKIKNVFSEVKENYEGEEKEDDAVLSELAQKYMERGVILGAEDRQSETAGTVDDKLISNQKLEIDAKIAQIESDEYKKEHKGVAKMIKQFNKKRAELEKLKEKIGKSDEVGLVPYEGINIFKKLKSKISESRAKKAAELTSELNQLMADIDAIQDGTSRAGAKAKIDELSEAKGTIGEKTEAELYRESLEAKGVDSNTIKSIASKYVQQEIAQEQNEQEQDGQDIE